MTKKNEDINWNMVHRTHEPNVIPDSEKAAERHWQQRLHNLSNVTLEPEVIERLTEQFTNEMKK